MADETKLRLEALRGVFQYWLDWNERDRTKEQLPIDDDTAIMIVPPHWPYRATIKEWIKTLNLALEERVNGG